MAVLIVAGTYAQAEDRAYHMGLKTGQWTYASDVHSLRGWLPDHIYYYGTYVERVDWWELQAELRAVQSRIDLGQGRETGRP